MRPTRDSLGLEPTAMHVAVGARSSVGPYQLTDLLGGGGMGTVHRAVGPDGSVCAVKLLRPDVVVPRTVERFAREASVRIDHPNVIRTLDGGVDPDGTPYIVFELLEGESLEARLTRGPIAEAEACALVLQACEGLAAAHAVGIVHRDLKPANLFLCNDGALKLLDFGVAQLPMSPKVTGTGVVLGTPSYLSPEQARGAVDVDGRADVWAIAAVLYEMLAGKTAFDGESFFSILLAILMEPVPPLGARAPNVSKELAQVVHRALAKDRDGRYQSVRAFADAVRSAMGGELPELSDTDATMEMPFRASLSPSEARIVAIVLAQAVTDYPAVERAIRERGGELLSKFKGTVLGLFGAAQWVGDESVRAVETALAMRPFVGRAAVASGRVSSTRTGLAGAAVGAAERGCRAELEGVAIDENTALTIGRRWSVEQAADGIYEVLAERPPSWMAPPRALESELVGRERELGQLRFAIETATREEHAMVVVVTGPTGIGKTSLRRAVEQMVEENEPPMQPFVARGEALHRDTAWAFVASMLRRHASARTASNGWPRLDPEAPLPQRREIVARLATEAIPSADEALRCAEFLGEILGVPMPDSVGLAAARAEPRLMADRIRLALLDWLSGHAKHGPIALVLEDLDWADGASLDVIEQLVEDLEETPLLVFATARKPFDQGARRLFGAQQAIHVHLKGLPRLAVAALASRVVSRSLEDTLIEALFERTEGNPLFVRELLLALDQDDRIDGKTLAERALPLSIEAAVQSRLDLLPQEEREAVRRASVLGRPFRAEDLAALGVDRPEAILKSLRQRDIVTRHAAEAGRREHQFRSALIAEVAYRSIAPEAVATLHQRVATLLAEQEGHDVEEIARHYDAAGASGEAATYFARAALSAATRGDSSRTLRCADRSIALGGTTSIRHALHMARAEALRFLGRRDEQRLALESALESAENDAERGAATRQLAFLWSRAGKLDEALAAGARAVGYADASGDATMRALVRLTLGQAQIFSGAHSDAVSRLGEAEVLSRGALPGVRAQLAELQALAALHQGDVGLAREQYELAVRLFSEAGNVREAAAMEQNLADVHNRFGAYADAHHALEQALDGCKRVGNRIAEAYALANLGNALLGQQRLDEANSALDDSEALASAMADSRLLAAIRIYRARVLLAKGETKLAAETAEAAASEAAQLGLGSLEVSGRAVAARARLALGEIQAALQISARALEQRDALGGVEEDEAEVFVVRLQVLTAAGQLDEAQETRDRGRERLEAIADRIADPTLRAQFLTGVPDHRELQGP